MRLNPLSSSFARFGARAPATTLDTKPTRTVPSKITDSPVLNSSSTCVVTGPEAKAWKTRSASCCNSVESSSFLSLRFFTTPSSTLLSLEAVMNFGSGTVASRHGYSKSVPKRCVRRRVGFRGSVPRARPRGRSTTRVRSARGPQRSEVGRAHRFSLALHAPRPASVGGRLPANAAVDKSGRLRGDGPRFARALAPFEGKGFGAERGHTRLSHVEVHSRERFSGRLRRAQGQEGLKSACRGGHIGTPARLAREPGQRGRPQGGGQTLRGDTRSDPRERRAGLRRSGLHRRASGRSGPLTRHQLGSRKARGGQARLRALAQEMGGGEGFRLGLALSAIGKGLRAAARNGGGASPRRVCLHLSSAGSGHPLRKFITRSRVGIRGGRG